MLSTIVFLAAASASSPAAGSYRYNAALAGVPAGTSTLTVEKDGDATQIQETASGSAGGLQFSGTAVLTLGTDLSPTQYAGEYTVAGQQAKVNVVLTPTTATVAGTPNGGQPQTFALDPNAKHFVVIEPGLLSGIFALPAQMQAWNDAAVSAIAPAYGREEALAPPIPANASTRPSDVPATDVSLALGGSIPFTVWYDPATLVPDEIIVPSQGAIVTRVRD